MSSAPKITTVKMPADPSLHPAHVVAIRPDVDGARTRRGDYVLSVETPKGARNVVAPADGVVRVHVSLMQDVAPGTELFSVSQDRPAAETRAPRAPRHEPQSAAASSPERPAAAAPVPPAEPAAPARPRRKVLSAVFLVFVMALAALWPGLVFAALDGAAEATPLLGVVAAVFGLVLLIAVWVLAKIPFISGRARAGVAALCAVVVFAGSLAGGVWSPKVRAVQQEVTAPAAVPVVALARARLEPVLGPVLTPVLGPLLGAGAEPAKPAQPAAERQLITLPNSAVSPRSAVEPLLGDIILVGFNFCPRGWRAADGQLFEITSNQSLYSVLGTNYGGDGVTTFAVPDLRGRAPVHRAAGSGPANEQPGRRGGSESTGMRQGNDKISAGRPHLVMNYCIAITGTFPKRN